MSTDTKRTAGKNKFMSSNKIEEVKPEPQSVKQVDTSIKITLDDFFRQLAEISSRNDLSSTSSTKS